MFLLHNLNNMQIVVLGVVGLETAMDFGSKEVKPRLMRGGGGLSMGSPCTIFRGNKTVPVCLIWPKMSMCYLHDIA